ncbi:MAG: NADH-ubiquinone oxidoreductase-F iron-sulfur binding region domain-containing protein [Patescibacteria group bacterium]
MSESLILKIEKAKLRGRGGAGFPVYLKWQAIAHALKKDTKTSFYIVINAAEGEPGVSKDAFILENETEKFLLGVKAAVKELGAKRLAGIYCFINHAYYPTVSKKINALLATTDFMMLSLFWHYQIKPKKLSYISGEETTMLNIIEHGLTEPRLKPPLPVDHGLFGKPTLINNVETFHQVALIEAGSFDNRRFYTINGEVQRPGVYYLPDSWSIADVLRLTGNWPSYKFFCMVGGNACGEVLDSSQLDQPVSGSGSITIYPWFNKNKPDLIGSWLKFFKDNSCGKCTPCREGTVRLYELYEQGKTYSPEFWDILELLNHGSFCAYGRSISLPLSSYYKNILKNKMTDK